MSIRSPGKPNSRGSSPSSSQRGTLEEMQEDMSQDPTAQGTSNIPPSKKTSYSMELFRTKKDIRWFQIPLSSLRRPKAHLFSFTFQSSLQEYQQLRKNKQLKIGRPFSMLSLPSLPAELLDSSRKTSYKRHGNHRRLGAGEAKGSKRLSSLKKDPQELRTRLKQCQSSVRGSLKRYIFCSKSSSQPQREESSSSFKEGPGQVDPGYFEQNQALEAPGLSSSSSSDGYSLAETEGSDHDLRMWSNTSSPPGAEDYVFPPDWSPPRIEFLYDESPPPLSPAPGPAPESQCFGEMPDISAWSTEPPVLEFTAKASSLVGGHLQPLEESIIVQPNKHESMPSPEYSEPVFSQVVNEEVEGLEDPTGKEEKIFVVEGHQSFPSPIYPLVATSSVCLRTSISAVSDEFSGEPENMACGSDVSHFEPEFPTPPISTHLLMPSSRMSSRCTSSLSSDDLSNGPEGMTLSGDVEEDTDDGSLLSFEQFLQMSDGNRSSLEPNVTILPSSPGCYLSSLDKLLEERRKQSWEDKQLEWGLGEKLLLFNPLGSVELHGETEASLPEAHRLILEQFSITKETVPAVYPGESIFWLPCYPRAPASLDTAGLKPQNQLENLFFSSHLTCQLALLRDGFLGALYLGSARCPPPVLRWLFQLMSSNLDISTEAFQTLWEISTHWIASADKTGTDFWCPNLKDIIEAFYNLGASAYTLFPAGLVQPELRPKDLECLEFPLGSAGTERETPLESSPFQLTLAEMLQRIFKFLTLCLASHPHCYPDWQRLALVPLLCRISLDRNLRKQPQVDLQQLLLILLEGTQEWQEKVPQFCRSLCHVSQHHDNLVAVVRSFPDTTARGQQLRRNLSLCFITKLLGKTQMTTSHWQEEIQWQQLGHLLPLMKPSSLKQSLQWEERSQEHPGRDQQETLAELDQEACYLCFSLLKLANVVVGTKAVPSRQQGCLLHLCNQLQQHISTHIREDPCLMYRTKLKDLAAQTYIKWQELLSQGWLQVTPMQNNNI